MSEGEVKSVSLEGSDVTRKTIKEYIKEDINNEKLIEPELSEGSGSKAIEDEEWKKAGKIISQIIRGNRD